MKTLINNEMKQRNISFDIMKGICIILVIVDHCGGTALYVGDGKMWSMLEHLFLAVFFFVSGYFYKDYSCFVELVVKKANKLVFPFLLFSIITVLTNLLFEDIRISFVEIMKHIIGVMFVWPNYLWFLKTLFLSIVIFYVINNFPINRICKCICTFTVGFVAYYFKEIYPLEGNIYSDIYNNVIVALIVQPFICCAYIFRIIFTKQLELRNYVILFIISLVVWSLSSFGGVFLVIAQVQNNIMLFYISSFAAILCLFSFCSIINLCIPLERINFIVSYYGKYSLIVYGIHITLIRFFLLYINPYICLLCVLSVMPVMIWVFKRLFPAFVAQRDLLIYEKGRVKVDFGAFSLKNR